MTLASSVIRRRRSRKGPAANAPAKREDSAIKSFDLKVCPFLAALRSFLGVGCSVFAAIAHLTILENVCVSKRALSARGPAWTKYKRNTRNAAMLLTLSDNEKALTCGHK